MHSKTAVGNLEDAENRTQVQRVLAVAYLFPPAGGAGVQRTVKFVKYLPDFGWQPTVLATSNPPAVEDESLMHDVPPQTPILRIRGIELPRRLPWRLRHWITQWLLVVDAQIGWLPFAVRAGAKLLQSGQWQAIYSTSVPYTNHLVALRLKRLTGLPWVADFRDPWLANFSAHFATSLHKALCARLERAIVFGSDRVVSVSEPMRQQFLDRYPDLPPSHFAVLPNGFDPDDFKVSAIEQDDKFTIIYAGSLYGQRQTARPFLCAVHHILEHNLADRGSFCIQFIGNTGSEARELATEWKLDDVVEFLGYLPHSEMIGHLFSADVLLLIIGSGPGADAVFTGKLFEYLATNRPILALTPPGAAADLILEAKAGEVVDDQDVHAISERLVRLYKQWQHGELQTESRKEVVAQYSRRRLAHRLADVLEQVSCTGL